MSPFFRVVVPSIEGGKVVKCRREQGRIVIVSVNLPEGLVELCVEIGPVNVSVCVRDNENRLGISLIIVWSVYKERAGIRRPADYFLKDSVFDFVQPEHLRLF